MKELILATLACLILGVSSQMSRRIGYRRPPHHWRGFPFPPDRHLSRNRRMGNMLSGANVCSEGGQRFCCPGWVKTAGLNKCLTAKCTGDCGDGICLQPDRCLCPDSSLAPSCSPPQFKNDDRPCMRRCMNGGTCTNNECSCIEGYTGAHCGQPMCGPGCLNGGRCMSPTKCSCPYGFTGPRCEKDYRTGPCYLAKTNDTCKDELPDMRCSKLACCATVGVGWGIPCEECPARVGNCPRGTMPPDCTNINECEVIPELCRGGECVDTIGSFRCECPEGYTYDAKYKVCTDVDECEQGFCEDGECTNTDGGFMCTCPEDYRKSADGTYCISDLPGYCYTAIESGMCTDALPNLIRRTDCCCDLIGGGEETRGKCFAVPGGRGPMRCPTFGTPEYVHDCSFGEREGPETYSTDICASQGNKACGPNGDCIVVDGDFQCSCHTGFKPKPDMKGCIDYNECGDGDSDICGAYGTCVNTEGSYTCHCNPGFSNSEDLLACLDIDECAAGEDLCENGVCINTRGSFRCSCNEGYRVTATQQGCEDYNECIERADLCEFGRCINIEGGFRCVCNPGFIPSPDLRRCVDENECESTGMCDNGQCINRNGGFECMCDNGYELTPDGKHCIDVDECVQKPCVNGECENLEGSFRCHCHRFQQLDESGRRCILDSRRANCYRNVRNGQCTAANALSTLTTRAECCCAVPGGVSAWDSCEPCPEEGSSNHAVLCTGVNIPNVCDMHTHPCLNGACINMEGNEFRCECNPGFIPSSDGKRCIDIDECVDENLMLCSNGVCRNTPGSFVCTCDNGFILNNDVCENVEECQSNPCIDGECVDTPGSFICVCDENSQLDIYGLRCYNVGIQMCWKTFSNNTCSDNFRALTAEECCNSLGVAWGDTLCTPCSEIELRCPKGFRYEISTDKCVDIPECNYDVCDELADCVETNGSFLCICPEPLTLSEDGLTCIDLRVGTCFYDYEESTGECSNPTNAPVMRKTDCCCTVGQGWTADECEGCPLEGTKEFDRLCPDGRPAGTTSVTVNECIMYPDLCENGKCENTADSFICVCYNGFTLEETGRQCIDIDECDISPGLCGNGECVNTEGSFDCQCEEGYQMNSAGTYCEDRNECLAGGRCTGGECVNTNGSYVCTCPEGRSKSEDGTRCVDIDECAVMSDVCQPNGQCVNMLGFFMCVCNPGFKPVDEDTNCEDIDECEIENGGCSDFCYNLIGSYECRCDEGFTLTYDGHTCADIDECLDQPNRCEGGRCENREGGFVCICFDGFMASPELDYCTDVDECMLNTNICLNGKCHNTRGSYTCNCDPGYCVPQGQMLCADEDECELGKHTCDINADCSNTDGSFLCECIAGFIGDGFECIDSNECETGNHTCDENAECENTQGSFACNCEDGFHGDGYTCSDKDDCLDDENLCGPHGTCLNIQGSFECECPMGFQTTEDKKACKDIDECAIEHICEHGRCHNTPGTFRCDCLKGFEKDEQGANCTDVDECEVVANCINGECVNTMGEYECRCPDGFESNPSGVGCVDVRTGDCFLNVEADEASPVCSNPIGVAVARATCCCSTYAEGWGNPCEFCPERNTSEYMTLCPGGDGFKPNPITVFLEDIDECMELPGLCQGGKCINVFGSFICECPEGYALNEESRVCEDVDECTEAVCGPGTCHNLIGSYSCLCPEGWMPINRGRDCVDQREANCYRHYNETALQCTDQLHFNTTKRLCCCTGTVGQGWNSPCEVCPLEETEEFANLCGELNFITDANICTKLDLCVNGVCVPTEDGYRCECQMGYRYSEDLLYCEDIDECSARDDLCVENAECINLPGSYRCNCKQGFKLQGERCVDINECIEQDACVNGRCDNSIGGFSCECDQGFRPINGDEACEDINECEIDDSCGHGTCQNAVGSFVCTCDTGFTLSANGDCVDIDECSDPNRCRNGICDNKDGSFSCLCNDGYKPSLDGRSCLDINECVEDAEICGAGSCVNMDGTHKCFCPRGYSDGGDGLSCTDEDECELFDLCKNGECVNTPGGFNCICPDNFALSNNKKYCVDQTRGHCYGTYDSGNCSNALPIMVIKSLCCCRCTETAWGETDDTCEECPAPGTPEFDDVCPFGCGATINGGDIDECLTNNPCQNGKCRNLAGGFECECEDGFKLDESRLLCVNENECIERRTNPCGPGNCVDTEGGFQCECEPGYYNGPMMRCLDINECREPTHGCKFRCVNTDGSYFCTCPDGFTLNEDQRTCRDIDECSDAELNRCEEKGMICKNHVGYFDCLCQPGYKKIGVSDICENINECEQTGVCAGGECIDLDGTYQCRCDEGYEYDEQGRRCIDRRRGLCYRAIHQRMCEMTGTTGQMVSKTDCCCSGKGAGWGAECEECPDINTREFVEMCPHGPGFDIHGEDIDDCVVTPGLCVNGTCTNLLGSYKCICDRGFMPTESMQECIDLDECSMQNGCAGGSRCRNTFGGYKCDCPAGYQITNTMRCVDIDECSTKGHSCQFICINTIGSYHCGCPHGFSMHMNESCVDRDECQEDSDICGRNAQCVNDVGGYHCVCSPGFEKTPKGDGCIGLPCDAQPGVCGGQMCMNMADGIRCVPGCNAGSNLRFNPLRCYKVQDCRASPCRLGQRCMPDERGDFRCTCDRGFAMMGGMRGGGCSDINECQFQNNPCSYGCKNSFGGYRCGCPRGYFGLGGGHCMQGYGGFQQPMYGGYNPYGPRSRCYDCGPPPPAMGGRQRRSADSEMEEVSGEDEDRPAVNTSAPIILHLSMADMAHNQRLIRLMPALRVLQGHTAYKIVSGNKNRMFRIHETENVHFIHFSRNFEETQGPLAAGKYKIKVEARPTLDVETAKRASLNNKEVEEAMEESVKFEVEFDIQK